MAVKFRIIPLFLLLLVLAGCASTNVNQQAIAPIRTLSGKQIHPGNLVYNNQFVNYSGGSLWSRIRTGFQLQSYYNNSMVLNFAEIDSKYPQQIYQAMQNSKPFLYNIVVELNRLGMPTELALLPIIESNYDVNAISNTGAIGIWQFMPVTAARFNLQSSWWYNGRLNVNKSTVAALDYLQNLYNLFNHDWLLAIAAYNAGEGTLESAIHYNARHGLPTDFWNLNLPEQTKLYVPRLLALAAIVNNPDDYNFHLPYIANNPVIGKITLNQQLSLELIASLAEVPVKTVYALNPEFTKIATPPKGTYSLNLPIDNIAVFKKNFANFPKLNIVLWKRYLVKKGDSLSRIAWLTGASVQEIKTANNLSSNVIYPGEYLLYTITSSNKKLRVYYVKPGDNLTIIAKKFNVTVADLLKWNGLRADYLIYPKQPIVIKD